MNETYTIKQLVEFQIEWYPVHRNPSRITYFNQSKAISCLRTKFQVEEQRNGCFLLQTSNRVLPCNGLKTLQHQHIIHYLHKQSF